MDEAAPEQTGGLLMRLYDAVERLEVFPKMGRIVPGSQGVTLRALIVDRYRIIQEMKREFVAIATVLHTAQDVGARLHDLRMDLP